jgi:hypothetical protein
LELGNIKLHTWTKGKQLNCEVLCRASHISTLPWAHTTISFWNTTSHPQIYRFCNAKANGGKVK